MQSKLLASGVERAFILIVDPGEEAFYAIKRFAKDNGINAASVSAIGAFESATIAFFDLKSQEYQEIEVPRQSEVLSMIGDVTLDENGNANPHLHVVLGLDDGRTRGGHFMKGIVRPTLEVIIRETPAALKRTYRPEFGISLIDVDA